MLSGYIAMLLESHPTTSRSTQAPTEKPLAAPTKKETIALSDDEYKDICRAAIAALYRKPLDIVKVDKKVGQVAYISYIRSSDGTTWRYKTKIENNNIVWGVTDGRWRTHKLDEALTYAYDSDRGLITIFVTYPDKSSSKWDYQI